MKFSARKDANQDKIVKALRQIGASVVSIHQIGNGLPDLIVGFRGKNYLLEVKDGSRYPSERKLTKDEKKFFKTWRGHCHVVESTEQAIKLITDVTQTNEGTK